MTTLAFVIIILIILYFLYYKNNIGGVLGGAVIKREKKNKFELSDEKKAIRKQAKIDKIKRKQDIKDITDDQDNYIIPKKYLDIFYGKFFKTHEMKIINEFNFKTPIEQLINVDNIPNSIIYRSTPYQGGQDFEKYVINIHKGQRKLFLCELFYLTKIHELGLVKPDTTVVYVGAGPGHHLVDLISLFPSFTYHLYDTRFDDALTKMKNVKLHLQFFTIDDCEKYVGKNIIFISDIRHPSMGDFNEPSAAQNPIIVRDQTMQAEWVRKIKPYATLLKFRLPWLDADQPYKYLDGQIYIQPYAPRNSTETRLLITDPDSEKSYSCKDYEDRMFFVNRVLRHLYGHRNISHNFDYAMMEYICDYYKKIMKSKENVLGISIRLNK